MMNIGNLGESIFEQWASQAGLIPNKAKYDRDAWDYIVGFPKNYDSDLKALDLDDSHTQCLIQVKTTTTIKGNRSIKLSNLKRLVDSSLPAFYLVINISNNGEPQKAWLFHVWEKLITEVLKRAREIDSSEYSKLNKIKVRLPDICAQEFEHLHGSELMKIIYRNIDKCKSKYNLQKQQFIKELGYADVTGSLNFQGFLPKNYMGRDKEFLVDLSLGLVDKIDVEEHSITDKRFGKEIGIKSGKGGYISIKDLKPEGEAFFKFWTLDFRKQITLATDYYLPNGLKINTKDEFFKVRYKANYLDFILSPNKQEENLTFKFEFPKADEEFPLMEMSNIADFFGFISEVQNKYEYINFSIFHEPEIEVRGDLSISDTLFNVDTIEQALSIKKAICIAEYFKLNQNLRVKALDLHRQYETIKFLDGLIKRGETDMRIEFWVSNSINLNLNTVIVIPIVLWFGSYLIAVQLVLQDEKVVVIEAKDGKTLYRSKSSNVKLERFQCLPSKENNPTDVLRELYEIISSDYNKHENNIIYLNNNN